MTFSGAAGRFEVERQIGSGGMATIYRALDRETGGTVALKVLHGRSADQAERFAQEAAVLAQLTHPAIVRYVAHGSTPFGEHYLAMEWLEGETLDERLERGALTIGESVALGRRVADALASTHRRGIVHRDIKPSNLFLPHGKVADTKLLDFGLARRVDSRRLTLGGGTIMGTPMYMAPEQARGEAEIGPRADVFSLGCVLFECLTGHPAFGGPTVMAVLAKICLDDSLPVRDLCPGLPHDLEATLERMLAKEHQARPRDGSAVEVALTAVADRLRITSDQPDADADVDLGPRSGKASRETLTTGEQRVICVVLVTRPRSQALPPPGADAPVAAHRGPRDALARAGDPTMILAPFDESLDETLRASLQLHGARMLRLLDGSIVVMLEGRGAPTDQAAQAARCALHLRSALPEAAMSISTGRAVMLGHLPVGDVIDRGASLLGGEAPGTISLDEATSELLRPRFEIAAGPGQQRRHLVGERASDADATPRTLLGLTTVCVGRDRELALLEGTFDDCVDEPVSRAVLVTAPAGGGKSRLRHELCERLRRGRAGIEVLVGRGDAMAAGSPFGLIAPAIRGAAGVAASDPPAARRDKLLARVARHVDAGSARRVAEFLGEMTGIPFDGEASAALHAARRDPRLMGDQLRRAWLDWLAAECSHHPILLVLEDVHWGDRPSVQLIDAALRALRDRPLMVLALARPEIDDTFPDLWSGRDVQRVTLRALTRKACLNLAQQILGEGIDPDVARWLVERADGNPFYVEELIRQVAAGSPPGSPVPLPETVVGMVQARLDSLGDESRRVLRAASLFGQRFVREGVAALLGDRDRAALPARLEALVAREVILPAGDAPDEYAFRHALLRDAAYAMLTEGDRGLGHLLAGEWLEKRGATDAIVLVEHFERGGDRPRAAYFCRKAADDALAGNDLAGAIARADRGAALGAAAETLAGLRLCQAQAHFWRGEYALAESAATQAVATFPEGSSGWFQALGELVSSLGQQGRYDDVARWTDAAGGAAAGAIAGGDATAELAGARTACLIRAAGYLLPGGRYEASDAILQHIGAATAGFAGLPPALAAKAHAVRATRCLHSGDQAAAIGLQEAALAAAAAAGDTRTVCEMRANLASVWADIGQIERAETLLRESLAEAQRMEIHYVTAVALINLGPVLAYSGRLPEAHRVATQALDFARQQRDQRWEGAAQLYLSTITFLAGEHVQSEQRARDAYAIVPAPLRPSAEAAIARALLAQGRNQEALEHARGASALLAEAGHVEEYESLVHLMLAEALEAGGQRAAARDALDAASARLQARAQRIGNAEWRASFLARLPDNARTLDLARAWGLAGDAALAGAARPRSGESDPASPHESKI